MPASIKQAAIDTKGPWSSFEMAWLHGAGDTLGTAAISSSVLTSDSRRLSGREVCCASKPKSLTLQQRSTLSLQHIKVIFYKFVGGKSTSPMFKREFYFMPSPHTPGMPSHRYAKSKHSGGERPCRPTRRSESGAITTSRLSRRGVPMSIEVSRGWGKPFSPGILPIAVVTVR